VRPTIGLILLSLMTLSACATSREIGGDPDLQLYNGNELPAPAATDMVAGDEAYLIGGYDKLSITVFGVPELSVEEVQADSAGRIAVPLVGVVNAGGRTIEDVTGEIQTRLRGYVRDPRVTLNLREAQGQLVTVSGEVRQPGVFPVIPRMTLMAAIARAQGITEYARRQEVIVFRTVNGQRMAAVYNYGAIQRGAYGDPRIYPNDIVMVGDSPGSRLFRDILTAAPGIVSPLIYIFR